MAVLMADPGPRDLILDPACGTGGFLITAMNHVLAKIRETERRKWRNPDAPSEREQAEVYRKIQDYAASNIVGVDINPNLIKATKMNMVMNNDGSGGIFPSNTLDRPVTWDQSLRDRDILGQVDFVFTNPPFGTKIRIDDPSVLEQYDLAHAWDYDEAKDTYSLREPRRLEKSQPPEILFIERCIQFLKPGSGILCIILPDAILGAPGLAKVREWILRQTRVLASIDLHPDTFQPRNSTQTSLLILQRKSSREVELEEAAGNIQDYKLFMALANHIGHDKRGNVIYVRDESGSDIIETIVERVREVYDGTPIYREVETKRKVVNDSTVKIAEAFSNWRKAQA